MLLIYLSAAWVAGIFLGSFFSLPLPIVFVGLIPLPLALVIRQHRKLIIMAGLCLVILLSGAVYYRQNLPGSDDSSLRYYNDRGAVEIKGVLDRDPEPGERTTHLHLSVREI
ncbi:MAG: DUF4131 domain-containing protein, partial [Dehalococcoidales bacterium]